MAFLLTFYKQYGKEKGGVKRLKGKRDTIMNIGNFLWKTLT